VSDDDKGGGEVDRGREDRATGTGDTTGSRGTKDENRSGQDGKRPGSPSMEGEPDVRADRVTTAAYEGGRERLNPERIEAVRDAYVYVDRRAMAGLHETSAAPGPVPHEEIEQLRAFYVPVPASDEMRRALRDRHLVVLVGIRGSGRSTTGLWLLDELTDENVARLDPDARPFLPDAEHIASANGYLACLDRGPVLSRVAADRLAADLGAKDAYCVLTANPSPALQRELGFYCVRHDQADPVAILGQQMQAGVQPHDDDTLAGRMAELADSREVADLLGQAARPSEAAQAAGMLLEFGRGERPRAEVDALITRLVLDDRIEEWFSVLVGITRGAVADRARRLTAMRIAVAVFDGLPRHIAESAAEPLAIRMATPPRTPGDTGGEGQLTLPHTGSRGVDPDEAATLLAATAISVKPEMVPFATREVPGETIAYLDGRMPSAVLRCVWHHYPLREPMVAWLGDLAQDNRQEVRLRAAQAAGLLGAVDFTYTLNALIRPAAEACPAGKPSATASPSEVSDEDDEDEDEDDDRDGYPSWKRQRERHQKRDKLFRRRRQFAAIAMDHAARDEHLDKVVRSILRRWRRSDDPALRWTAACAYGYDLGARNAALAFEELRVLGTPGELRPSHRKFKPEKFFLEESVFHASGEAIVNMFGWGAHREVLAMLHEWSVDPRWSVRLLALQAVVCLIPKVVATIGTPEIGGVHVESGRARSAEPLLDAADRVERARWPILIALHGRHSELQRQGAEMVRFALRSRDQKVVLNQFKDIYFAADDFRDSLPAVEAFLPLVITEESDRGRLLGLLHRMRDAWADPLSPDIADRLEDVIRGIRVMTGKKVFS
jgi:hypothetical protein